MGGCGREGASKSQAPTPRTPPVGKGVRRFFKCFGFVRISNLAFPDFQKLRFEDVQICGYTHFILHLCRNFTVILIKPLDKILGFGFIAS